MQSLHALSRVLIDDDALRAAECDPALQRQLWDLAVDHFAHLCLAWRLGESRASWSGKFQRQARAALADAAVLEEMQRRELLRLTAAFRRAGIDLLLLKGAALAYQVYPLPMLRSRDDTDLFIRVADRQRAAALLVDLGYDPAAENSAELATAQRHFLRTEATRFEHPVDLHWRVTNPLAYADALPFDRAWSRSVEISRLDGARGLCRVDALLLACLHRLAHHGDDSSLIWIYDINQLAGGFGKEDWSDLVVQAAANGLSGGSQQGLARAADLFGTPVPAAIGASLLAATRPAEGAFFGARVTPLRMLVSDWRALDTWGSRLRLLSAHLFPEPAYMVSKYGTRNRALLPLLYARRALAGLPRWLAGWR